MNAFEKYAAKRILVERLSKVAFVTALRFAARAAGNLVGKGASRAIQVAKPRPVAAAATGGAATGAVAAHMSNRTAPTAQTTPKPKVGKSDWLLKGAPPVGSSKAAKWTNLSSRNARLQGKGGYANWSTRQSVPLRQSLPSVSSVFPKR